MILLKFFIKFRYFNQNFAFDEVFGFIFVAYELNYDPVCLNKRKLNNLIIVKIYFNMMNNKNDFLPGII